MLEMQCIQNTKYIEPWNILRNSHQMHERHTIYLSNMRHLNFEIAMNLLQS